MGSRLRIGMVAASLAVVAGCSSTGSGGAAGSEVVDSATVAWTDNVCGAIGGFTRTASAQPAIDRTNPAAAVRDLGAYLSSTATALQEAVKGLDAAGPAPVAGGDEYVQRLKGTLTSIRTSFEDAGRRLAAVDTSSPEALAAALPTVVAPLQSLSSLADPTKGLESSDALRAAVAQASNCQQLRSR